MTTPDTLRVRAAVDAAYARLDMPSWPPPRPEGAEPRDEEYSRITDRHRYRLVHARAHAWTEALAALPGVVVEHLGPVRHADRAALDGDLAPGQREHARRAPANLGSSTAS